MTAAEDDRDDPADDAQLRQLRAVWLSMRDEEPSDRGMSALLAAARDRAAQMKPRESWWQRVLVTLRRPPVLALASVAVLLGGALVLTQRKDELQQVSTVTVDEAAPGAMPVTPSTTVRLSAEPPAEPPAPEAQRESAGSGMAQEAPVDRPAGFRRQRHGPTGSDRGVDLNAVAKDKDAAPDRKPDAVTRNTERLDLTRTYATPPAATGAAETSSVGQGAASGADTLDVEERAPAATTATPPRQDPVRRRAAPPIDRDDAGAVRPSPAPPTLAQLVTQCDAAAERGDCAKVRALARQIAARDAETYKRRVAGKPAIARCLLAE